MPFSLAPTAKPLRVHRYRSALEIIICMIIGFLLWCATLQDWSGVKTGPLHTYFSILGFIDFLIGAIACACVGMSRTSPKRNLLLIAASCLSSWAVPASVIGLIRIGRSTSRRQMQGLALWALATVSMVALGSPKDGWHWIDLTAGALTWALGAGLVLWSRNRTNEARLLETLKSEAETATRERDALARESAALERSRNADVARVRAEERTAIARDMHDNLSHHLSLISLHAGALAYRDDLSSQQIQETARTLQDAARSANEDLRDVLLALRSDGESPSAQSHKTPLPTSETVLDLVTDAQHRGQNIQLNLRSLSQNDLATLSPSLVAGLHRIISELLNNARKYAPTETLTLTMTRVDNLLVVRASNPISTSTPQALGTGMGLIGLEERARLLGGGVVTRQASETYLVEVHLPWRSKESA